MDVKSHSQGDQQNYTHSIIKLNKVNQVHLDLVSLTTSPFITTYLDSLLG